MSDLAGATKADFPLLTRDVYGKPIVYLDSAATSQKPQAVLDAMDAYYRTVNANVHRGAYHIADIATQAMEEARAKVQRFVGAASPREVVFCRNATEAVNLVAHSWGRSNLAEGDAVLLTHMEHHANIVPWHMLAAERGIELRWLPLDDGGRLDLRHLDRLLDGVRLVAFSAMSNVLGTIPPIRRIADAAHERGAVVLLDGAQYVPHVPTDVAELGCDFLAFSGHKMCGPTGIGALWGREELLEAMPPFMGGGEMILNVTTEGFLPNELPWKFEAGTPAIAEVVGLGAAVDYLCGIGMEAVRRHDTSLTAYALRTLTERHGDVLTIHGPPEPAARGGVLSFEYGDVHAHDISQVLDEQAVCVRAGHHCAKPLMRCLGVVATARASVYIYNDTSDIDQLSEALDRVGDLFGPQ
ncbi:MAG: SufS family cysteine desulfurase [bacterium]|nr:SufS family cysteine desulfurase [bacterium]